MTETKTRSLATKLAEVSHECAVVAKDGTNSHFKYKFTSAGAVLAKVNPALASRSIATTSDVAIVHQSDKLTTVKVTTTFTDGETGEVMVSSALGSGSDSGDKAVMKAQTAAQKYLLKLTFNIDFGDDPEADARTDAHAEAPRAAAPRPAAPASAPDESGRDPNKTFPFGRDKHKPIKDIGVEGLQWYLKMAKENLDNPEKQQWRNKTLADISILEAELAHRAGGANSQMEMGEDQDPFQ